MEQYLRNLNSGVVHRVFVVNGKRFSNEQCNLDDALDLAETTNTDGENCPHCFGGPPEADIEALGDAGESETDNG